MYLNTKNWIMKNCQVKPLKEKLFFLISTWTGPAWSTSYYRVSYQQCAVISPESTNKRQLSVQHVWENRVRTWVTIQRVGNKTQGFPVNHKQGIQSIIFYGNVMRIVTSSTQILTQWMIQCSLISSRELYKEELRKGISSNVCLFPG